MAEPRTTREYPAQDLVELLATTAFVNERATARMPAATLDDLLHADEPRADEPHADEPRADEPHADEPHPLCPLGPPAYAHGGTALPAARFSRSAVIVMSCVVTLIVALGLVAVL